VVNSLLVIDPKMRQHRKGQTNMGKPMLNNPNLIPVPRKNRYSNKEPGELAGDKEGILA
jgi:hypothetical protein